MILKLACDSETSFGQDFVVYVFSWDAEFDWDLEVDAW